MPPKYDTIVVGLGVSGVTALSILARHGKNVLGLEASDRVGGRIRTVPFGDGVVELGAEWIHGTTKSEVHDMATSHDIPLLSQDLTFKGYRSDGTDMDSELLDELLMYVLSLTETPPRDPEPLGQFLTRGLKEYIEQTRPQLLNDTDFMTNFLDFSNLVINNYEASDDWNDVTTSSKYEELEGHQHMSWHKNGYKMLFELLLKTFKSGPGLPSATLEFNKIVTEIVWPKDPKLDVVVKCKDGTSYTADNALVTVSLGVLKETHKTLFTPPLPKDKVEAIEVMSIGVMDKIILSFPEAWWPKDHNFFGFIWKGDDRKRIAEKDKWVTRIFGASRSMGAGNTLTLWTSGETGKLVETLPEDVVKRKTMELLRRFMGSGKNIPEPTGMVRSTWYTNPFTRGSYTYDNLQRPLYPNSRLHLAEPLRDNSEKPRVRFAGEATNPVHFSTVHGAMETGRREANSILGLNSKI